MKSPFKRIGVFAKYNSRSIVDTLEHLIAFLKKQQVTISIEENSALLLKQHDCNTIPREKLSEVSDLVVVVGGDGSLLNAARAIAADQIPIVGINRGSLGFLADILPQNLEKDLTEILQGRFLQGKRALLQSRVIRGNKTLMESLALNDIVLYCGTISRLIEFEVFINKRLVLRQRADGLITATPTGSTAYALSGGGPILYPSLNAFVLVPILPHTLTNRPIVVEGNSQIELSITENNDQSPKLSCDGQLHFDLEPGDLIHIEKYPQELTLVHPLNYDYFAILRQKLGWSTTPIKD